MNSKLVNYLLSEDTLLFEGGVLNRFVNYAKSTAYFPRNYIANMKVLFKYGKVTADDMIDFMNKQFEHPFSVNFSNIMIESIEELKKIK